MISLKKSDLRSIEKKACDTIDAFAEELVETARYIFRNPETRFQEHLAVNYLCNILERWGFLVEKKIGGLETAFKAHHKLSSTGAAVAFLAEYDALPELGHACGHHLIAGAALGALVAFQKIKQMLPGSVILLGTPGEEGGGGKVKMLEAGVFDNINAALMFHPSSYTCMAPEILAMCKVTITFKGKSSHAAESPDKGVDALQAIISVFNAVNALRELIRNDARIHGIITNGGVEPNIIPETASASFVARAEDMDYCQYLVDKLRKCAEGAALSTGAIPYIEETAQRKRVITSKPLIEVFTANWKNLGGVTEEGTPGVFSTDMGNVSQMVPAIHPTIAICSDPIPLHSQEFAEVANSNYAYLRMIQVAKALALTAIDFLMNEDLQFRAREIFEERKTAASNDFFKEQGGHK